MGKKKKKKESACNLGGLGLIPGLGRSRGIRWRGRWEGGSGWVIHVTQWLIHINVRQNPLQCREVVRQQLIKINEKKLDSFT